jgi:(4S)-4-hydroxy-5-phosphonooxypentane-2,3-dione isomerase
MAYVVSVTWTAKKGEEDAVAAALERLREPTLAEAGVLMWIPHRDPEDPKVFYIYEQYTEEAAYAAHTETEHFQRDGFGDAIPRLAERRREFYETMG